MISVVIPVFNERKTIEEILLRVQSVQIQKEIILVDDSSTDGTREFLSDLAARVERGSKPVILPQSGVDLEIANLRIFFQQKNAGKGAALRRGFEEARGEIIVIQDADLEYDPQEYPDLINPILRGQADVVYGSRFLGGPHRVLFFWHYMGNKFLTLMSNMVTDLNLSDVWTCYKAFKREVLQNLKLEENRFGFEQEITIKISKNRWRMYEVPISYYGRTYAEGKKITWKDGFRAIWCIFKYSVGAKPSPLRASELETHAASEAEAKVAERVR